MHDMVRAPSHFLKNPNRLAAHVNLAEPITFALSIRNFPYLPLSINGLPLQSFSECPAPKYSINLFFATFYQSSHPCHSTHLVHPNYYTFTHEISQLIHDPRAALDLKKSFGCYLRTMCSINRSHV
jgi:hypothetical protein